MGVSWRGGCVSKRAPSHSADMQKKKKKKDGSRLSETIDFALLGSGSFPGVSNYYFILFFSFFEK